MYFKKILMALLFFFLVFFVSQIKTSLFKLRMEGKKGCSVILKKDRAAYTYNYETITIDSCGQCTWEHDYTTTMRGADRQNPDRFSIYMTGFTPISQTIRIY